LPDQVIERIGVLARLLFMQRAVLMAFAVCCLAPYRATTKLRIGPFTANPPLAVLAVELRVNNSVNFNF
jgi:hypothetical protein